MNAPASLKNSTFKSKEDVFSINRDTTDQLRKFYRAHIDDTISKALQSGRRFGAMMLEPVLLGAGGMIWVDPLFQRELVRAVRDTSSDGVIAPLSGGPIPVIFDEVFVGLHRIGPMSTTSLLHVNPDIGCYAKVLTAGLLPMSVTLATEEIFNVFKSDKKSEALLHGHSYTAHPIGCAVALKGIEMLEAIPSLKDPFHSLWDMEVSLVFLFFLFLQRKRLMYEFSFSLSSTFHLFLMSMGLFPLELYWLSSSHPLRKVNRLPTLFKDTKTHFVESVIYPFSSSSSLHLKRLYLNLHNCNPGCNPP
jgi:hypothetical protein